MDKELLVKYLLNECSEEEIRQFRIWLESDRENADFFFRMERIWELKDEKKYSDEEQVKVAFDQLLTSINHRKKKESPKQDIKNKVSFKWIKNVAAVLLLSLALSGLFHYLSHDRNPIYYSNNTIDVPKGSQTFIELCDGTKVWLNSNSKLTYPSVFSDTIRAVRLVGEGYFEVTNNPNQAFVINGDKLNVKVLGTKFNFKSYPDETTRVTLKEGKIEVYTSDRCQNAILHPHEQVNYAGTGELQVIKISDISSEEGWIYGNLVFVEESLENIAKIFNRKFNKNFVISNSELSKELFTGHFSQEKSLVEILDILKKTYKMDYNFKNDTIFITNEKITPMRK